MTINRMITIVDRFALGLMNALVRRRSAARRYRRLTQTCNPHPELLSYVDVDAAWGIFAADRPASVGRRPQGVD